MGSENIASKDYADLESSARWAGDGSDSAGVSVAAFVRDGGRSMDGGAVGCDDGCACNRPCHSA